MNASHFQHVMIETWRSIVQDAQASKHTPLATVAFGDWYATLRPEEKAAADFLLAEWVHSVDEGQQFDALALIRRFRIRSALPSLERLSGTLEHTTGPGAPFLRSKVLSLREYLASASAAPGSPDE